MDVDSEEEDVDLAGQEKESRAKYVDQLVRLALSTLLFVGRALTGRE